MNDQITDQFFEYKRKEFLTAFFEFNSKSAYRINAKCKHETKQVCYGSIFTKRPERCTSTDKDTDREIFKQTCEYCELELVRGHFDAYKGFIQKEMNFLNFNVT